MARSKIRNVFVGAIIRAFTTILGPQSMTYGENGTRRRAIIVGAGPAGLTAAWRLKNHAHIDSVVIESEGVVGGISRTVRIKGWSFDLGGHRFFTKSSLVNEIWDEMLYPDTFLMRPRKSRIYYAGKYFDYPLKPLNALLNLGVIETIRCISSYILVKVRPPKEQSTFEDWVAARFGWRLYKIFFKTYTEKVWGISTRKLQSTWAAQRIKNLSLLEAVKDAFGLSRKGDVTTLISKFKYPEFGPGQLWEAASEKVTRDGIELHLENGLKHVAKSGISYHISTSKGIKLFADCVFSSLPLSLVPNYLSAPQEILDAGEKLKYRDFLIVAVPILIDEVVFDDNWIYVHDPKVKVGRIQNYGSWSPSMVKVGTTCLGLEYFVNKGDELWKSSDEQLIALAIRELETLGLKVSPIRNSGFVVRVEKAYPVYDEFYLDSVAAIKDWLKMEHPNWYQIGRNGQHRYNNQDHSMLTAVYAVDNYLGLSTEDYWEVNLDDDYHEESKVTRDAPVFQK